MKHIFFSGLFAIIFYGCSVESHKTRIDSGKEVLIDTIPGLCPYLTKDHKGNIVLSWVRMINDSSAVFCYAVSNDGRSFGNPVVIPGSDNIQPHGENLPKIVFKPSGEVIALWGTKSTSKQNKHAGMVSYSQSFDGGHTWGRQIKSLVADSAATDQRYYDVALLPGGEVGIIWLDNRKSNVSKGSALFFASTNGRNGFAQGKRIAESCCQCCRTDLFVDHKGAIHTLYRGVIRDSIRDMVHAVSQDGGKTFSQPARISDDNWILNACPHTGPSMTENPRGLQFTWFTGGKNKGSYYASSGDNGRSFTHRDQVSELGSHPQVAAFPQGRLAIVWDETTTSETGSGKRIGLQIRSADGQAETKEFISNDSCNSNFPVIVTTGNNKALVAYSQKRDNHNYIAFQRVNVN